jgi:hypothetical protein
VVLFLCPHRKERCTSEEYNRLIVYFLRFVNIKQVITGNPEVINMSYPHCPQVFPQAIQGKTPEKPRFFRGEKKYERFFHKTV